MRNRPIKEKYAHIYKLKEELLRKRLLLTKMNRSPDWSEDDVKKVLKSLKAGKCPDPHGMINEIFKLGGDDMVRSLTMMMNGIKNETFIPDQIRYKNISTIYKNKGSRMLLKNDRGVFTSPVLNTILQKLLLNSNYEEIDSNLTDSNVGARKKRSIRNHNWVINGIIKDTLATKDKAIDLLIMDYAQCFDSLDTKIVSNELFETGVQSDHLNLIYESDSLSKVAIKTPVE